jgi:hypothetical protein
VKKLLGILILFAAWFTMTDASALCATSPNPYVVPTGYAIAAAYYSPACAQTNPNIYFNFNGYPTTDNYAGINPLFNLPVGAQSVACSFFPVPTGWTVTGHDPATCTGLPGDDIVIVHTSCVAGVDTNCYPPNPVVSYSPNPAIVPYGQSSMPLTVSYSGSPGNPTTCIYQAKDTTDPHNPIASSCSSPTAGSAIFTVLAGHSYLFWIGDNNPVTQWAKTAYFNVTQGPAATISATPNPVIIPFGKSSNTNTLSWNAPYYSQATLYGVQNISNPGQILCLGNVSSVQSVSETVVPNEVATLYLTAPTGCAAGTVVPSAPAPVLGQVTVTTQQGARPALHASANPVTIPVGQSSQSYTLSWTAPGYSSVSLYGKQNLYAPGQTLCLGNVSAPGSVSASMSVGEIADIYLTANTNCTAGQAYTVTSPFDTLHITTN